MDKSSKVLFMVWAIFAIASFVSAFWAPVVIAIINWIFGALNIMILGSLGISQLQVMSEVNKAKRQVEEELSKPQVEEKPKRKKKVEKEGV